MARQCPEDFNPWPPFVDIFASVILVMLLFLLITIVNIGYYAQFKFKTAYTASVETKTPIESEESSKITTAYGKKEVVIHKERVIPADNTVSFHKIDKPKIEVNATNSFFQGGKAQGNAVSYAINKTPKAFLAQQALAKVDKINIIFEDKEIFLNIQVRSKIRKFIDNAMRKSRKAEFTIFVTDPHGVISSTIAKQISLGRAINIKNQIIKSRVTGRQIHLNLRKKSDDLGAFGTITIESYIP